MGIEEPGGVRAGGDEVSLDEDCRATERKAQSLSKPGLLIAKVGYNLKGPSRLGQRTGGKKPDDKKGLLRREEDSAVGNGKAASVVLEVQTSGSAKKEVKFGSKKLWTTLFPPSFDCRQGFRSRNEPLLREDIGR